MFINHHIFVALTSKQLNMEKASFWTTALAVGVGVLVAAIIFKVVDKLILSKALSSFELQSASHYEEHAEEDEE